MDAPETNTEPTAEAAEQPQDEQGLGDAGKTGLAGGPRGVMLGTVSGR